MLESLQQGPSLYSLLPAPFAAARPTLVLTQQLCEVCAPSGAHVAAACRRLPGNGGGGGAGGGDGGSTGGVRVVSLEPHTLADVADTFEEVSLAASGSPDAGRALSARFHADIERVAAACGANDPKPAETRRLRVFLMEWADPVFDGGHWVRLKPRSNAFETPPEPAGLPACGSLASSRRHAWAGS